MGASVLIVGRPGPLRDGLHALVGSMPQIDAVAVVNDGSSLLMSGIDPAPALVVLDADSTSDSVWRLARQAKLKWSRARIIVLVGSVEQQQEAEDAGADAVLLQGFPAGRLVTAIVEHVPQSVIRRMPPGCVTICRHIAPLSLCWSPGARWSTWSPTAVSARSATRVAWIRRRQRCQALGSGPEAEDWAVLVEGLGCFNRSKGQTATGQFRGIRVAYR